MNWQLVVTLVGSLAGGGTLGAVIGALAGRQAALKNAEAAGKTANATLKQAVVAEREAASADWARYCDAQQKWNESLAQQIGENNKRLADAEMRAAGSELRASKAEALYSTALAYLRHLAGWFAENWPGEKMPTPPPELEADLDSFLYGARSGPTKAESGLRQQEPLSGRHRQPGPPPSHRPVP
ncbi:hypothetical protein [Mycobacterium intracellulare]|uniref:hypothetical protein n=1 Tax=Mycobacterium intracellulare TaxID=1767 RepID=UPI000CE382BD|nr:hypothetical protein [Mycobacterium intracellulare]